MNNTHDEEYNRLLRLVLDQGRVKKNRTGIDTIGVFGAQARFDLSQGFPLLTTKKVFMKGITHELLWFLSGSTNIKYLVDNDVHIWDGNAFDKFSKTNKVFIEVQGEAGRKPIDREQYIANIKFDPAFAKRYGDLGEGTYGGMWRKFPHFEYDDSGGTFSCGYVKESVDQIAKAVDKLRTNPDDRRIIVSAWHPYWVDHCALPPCHVLFHFNTEELTTGERLELWQKKMCKMTMADGTDAVLSGLPNFEGKNFDGRFDADGIPRRRLNCLLYQRSCDLFLGIPFNIASYALLTHMVAQVTNMVPGTFVHTYGDLHLYENHIPQAREQLTREPITAPQLWLNPAIKEIGDFKYEDIQIKNYLSHPTLKGEMAV